MASHPYHIIFTTSSSNTESFPKMALDVLSLTDDGHSNARCVHDDDKHTSDESLKATRKKKKKKKKKERRMSLPEYSKSGSTLTITTVNSTTSSKRRRRKTMGTGLESFGDLVSRDLSLRDLSVKKRKGKKNKKKKDTSIKSLGDPFESGKTEHTSNLTEHTSDFRRKIETEIDKAWDPLDAATEHTSNKLESNHQREDVYENTDDESRQSRFATLLNKWKKREDESREKQTVAGDGDSKASYLAESETETCFEGVLKHWIHRDHETKVETRKVEEPHENTVVVDDGASVISSLAWGDDSDSRFDFAYDARFDSLLRMSPASMVRKSLPNVYAKKKKKSGKTKKDDSKKKRAQKMKKNKSKKRLDASESVLDASESALDVFESVLDITETSTTASLEDSPSLADQSKSKRKKKKKDESSKSKKKRAEKMKKKKSKMKLVGSEVDVDASESTIEASESTVDVSEAKLDVTQTSFVSLEDDVPTSDDEAAIKAYLPDWLSPKDSSRKSAAPGAETPTVKKDIMLVVPELLLSPAKPAGETQRETTEKSDPISEEIPYLPNIRCTPTAPATETGPTKSSRPDP